MKFFSKALEIFHLNKSKSDDDDEPKICYFDTLPRELVQVILSFLPKKKDVFRARLVCKEWSQICKLDNPVVWNNFIVSMRTHHDPVLKEKPTPRVCHTAVVHEDSMIILGGHTGSTFSFGDVLNDCWKLHIPTRTWHRLPGSFVHNTEHTAVMHNDVMYVFGGYYRNYVDELFCYDFKSATYNLVNVIGAKPRRRSACVSVIYNNCLYIYGGWDGIYGGNHNDMYYFDFETKQWTQVQYASEFVPPPLRSVNGVVYKDGLYLHGGFGATHPDELFKFNFETKEWSVVKATGNGPCGRSRSKMVVYKHKLYVMGGWDRKTYYNDYYEFNFLTNNWTKLDVNTQAIGQHSMVVYHDAIYIFGGFSAKADKPVNKVYVHHLSPV